MSRKATAAEADSPCTMVVRANAGAATLQHGAQLLHFIFNCAVCPVDESRPVSAPWVPAPSSPDRGSCRTSWKSPCADCETVAAASRGEWCPGPHPPMVIAASPFRGTAAAMNQIRRRRTTPNMSRTLPQRIEKNQPARQSMDRLPTRRAQKPYRFVMSPGHPASSGGCHSMSATMRTRSTRSPLPASPGSKSYVLPQAQVEPASSMTRISPAAPRNAI